MPEPLLALIGFVLTAIGIWGLAAGKIIAGARGLRSNVYYRKDSPLQYYGFVLFYLAVGSFLLRQVF